VSVTEGLVGSLDSSFLAQGTRTERKNKRIVSVRLSAPAKNDERMDVVVHFNGVTLYL
jgi:hypothetical protein